MKPLVKVDPSVAPLLSKFVATKGVERTLRTIRKHLSMDVAFISSFREDVRVMVSVDAGSEAPIQRGACISLNEGYCLQVVQGTLPHFIADAAAHPIAKNIPATAAIPIGSHLSVPIQLESGETYGTLCCFSYVAQPTLTEHHLQILQVFSEVLAERLDENLSEAREEATRADRIQFAMCSDAPRIVYQPLFDVASGRLTGVECLSRFDMTPARTPDIWFEEAFEVGLGVEFEMHAIEQALPALNVLPSGLAVAVNASPETVISGRLVAALRSVPLSRLVLEITEHATVSDYRKLEEALAPLRKAGARLAVDDAGAGYASMRHILNLKPEVIKLDMSLTRDIDVDPSKRALARGLISFGKEIGTQITAEGVETQGELAMLRRLGVDKVQGYLLGKPMSLEGVVGLAQHPPFVH